MSAQSGDQQQVSKGLLIALGAVAAIGAAFALWTFVLQPLTADDPASETVAGEASPEPGEATPDATPGAGEASPAPGEATPGPGEDDQAGDDPEGGPSERDDLGDPVEVVNARDPFQQLVVESTGGGGASGSGTGVGGTPTGTGTGSGDGSGDGSDTGSGGDSGQDQADVDAITVTLVDVYTGDDGVQRASIEVDDTGYDVLEGETFAESFQLLDIAETCATMLYGDSRFTLCEGDAVRK